MTREDALKILNGMKAENLNLDDLYTKDKYEALNMAINALEYEPNTWSLDDAREDFVHDVYNTLDSLPTNDEANRIIDIFDRVTSGIRQEPVLDKIRAEIESHCGLTKENHCRYCSYCNSVMGVREILEIIDKYRESEE